MVVGSLPVAVVGLAGWCAPRQPPGLGVKPYDVAQGFSSLTSVAHRIAIRLVGAFKPAPQLGLLLSVRLVSQGASQISNGVLLVAQE